MTPDSDKHTEVTMKQTASGTWEPPKVIRRTLKSWQRLWVVSGAIYLLLLAGSCYVLIPDQVSIERRMVFSVMEEVRRYDGMAFAGDSPEKIFEIARKQGYAAWITATKARYRIKPPYDEGFDIIDKNFKEALSDLPMKRIVGLIICMIVWLVPMAVFYAFGFVIDWIRSGAEGN